MTELEGRRVLVTGATGFVGSHLAAALASANAAVHAIRRSAGSRSRLGAPDASIVWHEADLQDPASLVRAIAAARPDVVFHLAAYGTGAHDSDRACTFRVNVTGTWNLWQALGDRDVRFVYTGSCGEYGVTRECVSETHPCRPTWFYPATVHAAGALLATLGRETRREVVILRPFNCYGPGDRDERFIPHVITTLLEGKEAATTAGEQRRDFLFVDDLVDALARAAVRPLPETGVVFNIGSGRASSLRDVIGLIAARVGNGAASRVRLGALPYRDDEVWYLCADITRARHDLGFVPRVTLEDGLSRTVGWYAAHTNDIPLTRSELRR